MAAVYRVASNQGHGCYGCTMVLAGRMLVVHAALLAACGGDGSSAIDLAAEYASRFCRASVACDASNTREECIDSLDVSAWQHLEDQVESGLLPYNDAAADRCLSLRADDACTARTSADDMEIRQFCSAALAGTAAPGHACVADEECESGERTC